MIFWFITSPWYDGRRKEPLALHFLVTNKRLSTAANLFYCFTFTVTYSSVSISKEKIWNKDIFSNIDRKSNLIVISYIAILFLFSS